MRFDKLTIKAREAIFDVQQIIPDTNIVLGNLPLKKPYSMTIEQVEALHMALDAAGIPR